MRGKPMVEVVVKLMAAIGGGVSSEKRRRIRSQTVGVAGFIPRRPR